MIIQCDFDGTITTNNLSVLIREKFAPSEWRNIESDYVKGRLTVEQSNRVQYTLVRETRETLVEFVIDNFKLRPGFLEFVNNCRDKGIRFAIVSSGLDFYIEAVLGSIGITDLEVHCAGTAFTKDGVIVTYLDAEGHVIDSGFKKKYLAWLMGQGRPVVYLGDGLSDFDAASAADYVFACDHLRRLLSASSVPHYEFSDFSDVWQQISHLENMQ